MCEYMLTAGNLLDNSGNLIQCGYSDRAVRKYSRLNVNASDLLITEWDSYTVIAPGKYAFCAAVADCGYRSVLYTELTDITDGYKSKSITGMFPLGSLLMPSKPECGEAKISLKGSTVRLTAIDKTVNIQCLVLDFNGTDRLSADIILTDIPKKGLFTALTFDSGKKFFLSDLHLCGYGVSGSVNLGSRQYSFGEDSFCIYNRMRGVLPCKNQYFYACGYSRTQDLTLFIKDTGANTEGASENGLIYNGKLYKTGKCRTERGEDKTVFISKNMTAEFIPEVKSDSRIKKLIGNTRLHREYGTFSGNAVIDGQRTEFNNLAGEITVVR